MPDVNCESSNVGVSKAHDAVRDRNQKFKFIHDLCLDPSTQGKGTGTKTMKLWFDLQKSSSKGKDASDKDEAEIGSETIESDNNNMGAKNVGKEQKQEEGDKKMVVLQVQSSRNPSAEGQRFSLVALPSARIFWEKLGFKARHCEKEVMSSYLSEATFMVLVRARADRFW